MIYHVALESSDHHDPWQTPRQASDFDAADACFAPAAEQSQPGPPRPAAPRRAMRTAIAWCVIIISTLAIMVMQYKVSEMPPPTPSDASPGLDMVLVGRLAIGFDRVFKTSDAQMMMALEEQAAMSPFATTDYLRIAIVAAELEGAQTALERIAPLSDEYLDSDLEPPRDFLADRRLLTRIYSSEAYVPTPAEADGLIRRHGWFGELAAGYNLPAQNALHQAPRVAASMTIYLLVCFGLLVIFAGLAGFGLLITGVIFAAMGKFQARFEPGSLSHNSAYLEMVAIFLVGFILLQVLAAWLTPSIGIDLTIPLLLLLITPLAWPLLCGVSFGRYRRDMGLTAPRGLFKEIGAGVLGYLAGLPIIFIGAIVTVIFAMISGMDSDHPARREILTGNASELVVLFLGAVVWAPLVEEMVFRAGFYRHLRKLPGWGTWLLATLVTSFIFAAIHPQGIIGIPVLMSIAIILATLRQWRGSLVAPITAHAVHNGTIITLLVVLLYI